MGVPSVLIQVVLKRHRSRLGIPQSTPPVLTGTMIQWLGDHISPWSISEIDIFGLCCLNLYTSLYDHYFTWRMRSHLLFVQRMVPNIKSCCAVQYQIFDRYQAGIIRIVLTKKKSASIAFPIRTSMTVVLLWTVSRNPIKLRFSYTVSYRLSDNCFRGNVYMT